MTNNHEHINNEVQREELHTRKIDFKGFRRSDGLFEVEARVLDSKPYEFDLPNGGGTIPPNQHFHNLGICVTFDNNMTIKGVRTISETFPYLDCQYGGQSLQALIGLTIGPGWSKKIRSRLPTSETCTHLRELLIPLATAAFQAMQIERSNLASALDDKGRPLKLNTCYAYGESREIVKRTWPTFYRSKS